MNRVLASRVSGMLVLLALAVTACNADESLHPGNGDADPETARPAAVGEQGTD
jgi:hypothetical protein